MEDLKNTWGKPKSYKGVLIYPVQMKYINKFYQYINCLIIEKNKIPDVSVIKMSYLRFLYDLSHSNEDYFILWKYLTRLLILVFRHKFHFLSDGEKLFIKVKDKILNEQDFDEIRKIICKQNLIVLNEDLLNPEVERAIAEARDFMVKKETPATIEENIFSFFAATGYELEKIKNLTIYIFNKTMQRLDLMKTWEVYLYPSLKSGESDKIPHWLSHMPERGLYDDVTMTEDDFKQKTSDNMYQK